MTLLSCIGAGLTFSSACLVSDHLRPVEVGMDSRPGSPPDFIIAKRRLNELNGHASVVHYRHLKRIYGLVGAQNDGMAHQRGRKVIDLVGHVRLFPQKGMERGISFKAVPLNRNRPREVIRGVHADTRSVAFSRAYFFSGYADVVKFIDDPFPAKS